MIILLQTVFLILYNYTTKPFIVFILPRNKPFTSISCTVCVILQPLTQTIIVQKVKAKKKKENMVVDAVL